MNFEEEAELDRILTGADYVEGGKVDEEPGPLQGNMVREKPLIIRNVRKFVL